MNFKNVEGGVEPVLRSHSGIALDEIHGKPQWGWHVCWSDNRTRDLPITKQKLKSVHCDVRHFQP